MEPYWATKGQLSTARSKFRKAEDELLDRLKKAVGEQTADEQTELVLDLERQALAAQLERYVASHRQRIGGFVEGLWDKHRVTIEEIENERDTATEKLAGAMKELGYV